MQGCLGGVVGAIGLSAISSVYHRLFFGPILNDGQYAMVWMFTVPAGAILGFSTAYALTTFQNRPVPAGLAGTIAFGLVAVPLGFYLFLTTMNSPNTGTTPIAAFCGSLLFALPTILWMVALLIWSFRLLGKKTP